MKNFHKSKDSALELPVNKEGGTVREEIQASRDEQAALLREKRRKRDELRVLSEQDDEQSKKLYSKWLNFIHGGQHPESSERLQWQAVQNERQAARAQAEAQGARNDWQDHEGGVQEKGTVTAAFYELKSALDAVQMELHKGGLGEREVQEVLPSSIFQNIERGLLSEYRHKNKGPSLRDMTWEVFSGLNTTIKNAGGMDKNFVYLSDYYGTQVQDMFRSMLEKSPNFFADNEKICEGMMKVAFKDAPRLQEESKEAIRSVFDSISSEKLQSLVRTSPSVVDVFVKAEMPLAKESIQEVVRQAFYEDPDSLRDFEMLRVKECFNVNTVVMEALASAVSEKYGLKDGKSVVESWQSVAFYDKSKIQENVARMEELEMRQEGAVKLLVEYYGIKEFHRYPQAMLVDQVQKHGQDVPQGVIIYPRGDHNNAFDNSKIFTQLHQETQGRHTTRIFEVQDKAELIRMMVKIRKGKHKVEYLIIGAHGEPHGIHFDDVPGEREFLSKDDLLAIDSSEAIRGLLAEDCPVVLESCSTGALGGFAQELSGRLGKHVQGPEIPAAVESLELHYDQNGRPKLEVTYVKDGNTDIRAEYNQGENIEV